MKVEKKQVTNAVVVLELSEEEAGKLRYEMSKSVTSFSEELWAQLDAADIAPVFSAEDKI